MPIPSIHPRRWLANPFAVDLRSLALSRALLGLVLFVDLCRRCADLRVFYTDAGVMPRDWLPAMLGPWRICLHAANGDTWFIASLFALEMLAALAFSFGWRTRRSAVICYVLHASLLNRNMMVLEGGDILIVCLLFWHAFLPSGARWSVDAALSRAPALPNRHVSWASAGLVLQVLSVYYFSAVLKSGRDWWPDGTAIDYAMQLDAFTTDAGRWLRNFPQAEHGLSLGIFFLEMIGPWLVLSPVLNAPLRMLVVAALMLMHLSFVLFMNIGPFPFVSIASLSALIVGGVWQWLDNLARRNTAPPLRIYYDRDCGFCLKTCLLLREILILPHAQIAPAQDTPRANALLQANGSWVVIDREEQAWLKFPAFAALLRASPLLRPAGWLLGMAWAEPPGNAVYDFVARHRARFAAASERLLPWRDGRFESGSTAQAFAAFMLIVLLAWNMCTVGGLPNRLYALLTPPLRAIRLDQYWNMFAPFPSRDNGWFVIPAQLADGREIDLRHPERAGLSYEKPADVAAEYPNTRWLKYYERLWSPEFSANRDKFASYLCKRWNADHSGPDRLRDFKLVFMLQQSVPQGQTPKIEQRIIARHDCFASP